MSWVGDASQMVGIAPDEPQKVGKNAKNSNFGCYFSHICKVLKKCYIPFLLAFEVDFQKAFENFCVLAPIKP